MGKAGRWFRGLLGLKKEKEQCDAENSNSTASNDPTRKEKKRWSFTKPGKDCGGEIPVKDECTWRIEEKQSKHAMADAAVSAAQAAVAVVRLTANNRGTLLCGNRELFAALMIQTIFRGYLARKALRALRALVKLQALVRGFLVRKRASAALLSMEALVRAQLIVKLQRSRASHNKENRFQPRKSTEKRFDDSRREFHSKRVSTSYETMMSESPTSVEVDTYKPKSRSPMSHHIPPRNKRQQDLEWSFSGDEIRFCTAHNTPRLQTSNSPAKSERCFRDYSNYPNYMSNTQSYMAKLRSNSAPKQRPETGPKKMTLTEIMAARKSVSAVGMHRENQHLFNFSGEAPLLR